MIKSPIPAPRVLLMGPGGTGKTFSLRTLVECGVTPYILSLDPGGLAPVGDIPPDKLGWHVVSPPATSWAKLIEQANNLGSLTFEGITKSQDFKKSEMKRHVQVLETLANFKDDRTGKVLGMVDTWGTDRAIVIDHLTELSQVSKEWAVGSKLVLHEGEWQVAQNNLENLLRNLVTVCRCWVVLIAHVDRETDIVLQATRIMVHTLGRKLAPKLPIMFTDVVLAAREGKEFRWDTARPETDLKTQNLAIEAKLPPSFRAICDNWKKRGGIIEQPAEEPAAKLAVLS